MFEVTQLEMVECGSHPDSLVSEPTLLATLPECLSDAQCEKVCFAPLDFSSI